MVLALQPLTKDAHSLRLLASVGKPRFEFFIGFSDVASKCHTRTVRHSPTNPMYWFPRYKHDSLACKTLNLNEERLLEIQSDVRNFATLLDSVGKYLKSGRVFFGYRRWVQGSF